MWRPERYDNGRQVRQRLRCPLRPDRSQQGTVRCPCGVHGRERLERRHLRPAPAIRQRRERQRTACHRQRRGAGDGLGQRVDTEDNALLYRRLGPVGRTHDTDLAPERGQHRRYRARLRRVRQFHRRRRWVQRQHGRCDCPGLRRSVPGSLHRPHGLTDRERELRLRSGLQIHRRRARRRVGRVDRPRQPDRRLYNNGSEEGQRVVRRRYD